MRDQADASFTFLHRVEEVELNIADRRWQSALALALTLPDICGGIAYPDLVKHYRDGRVQLDRYKNPTRDVGGQYIRWFDTFAAPFFKLTPQHPAPYICGERCWQLRCEYLHQNKGFVNEEAGAVRFHLGVNCGSSVCSLDTVEHLAASTEIRIDIEQFCRRMCAAARHYYETAHEDKDFSLYNTPVLDFVKAQRSAPPQPPIGVLCPDTVYANGLKLALEPVNRQVQLYYTPDAVRQKAGKRPPVLWVAAGISLAEAAPWGPDTPVLLLQGPGPAEEGQWTPTLCLPQPVQPEALRKAVRGLLYEKGGWKP